MEVNKEQAISVFDQVARKYLGSKKGKFTWDEAKLIQAAINKLASLAELEIQPDQGDIQPQKPKPKK